MTALRVSSVVPTLEDMSEKTPETADQAIERHLNDMERTLAEAGRRRIPDEISAWARLAQAHAAAAHVLVAVDAARRLAR